VWRGSPPLRQYLYFCTSKAKCVCVRESWQVERVARLSPSASVFVLFVPVKLYERERERELAGGACGEALRQLY
jgi:hypothetical protein